MMKKNRKRPYEKNLEEFAFDLTPDLTDGAVTMAHDHRAAVPQGSETAGSRGDDKPHLGRKGGAF